MYNRATMECFKCHKLRHFQYECPNLNKKVNFTELNQEQETLLMVYVYRKGTKMMIGSWTQAT